MTSERDELAARQLSLVTALVAGGPPPVGVDPERVRLQALALLSKRFRSVVRRCSGLGADLWPAFQRYVAADPSTPTGTSDDAQRFTRYLREAGADGTCLADPNVDSSAAH